MICTRRARQRARPHEAQDVPQPAVGRVERGAVTKALRVERRHLQRDLPDGPEQRADRHGDDRVEAEPRHQRDQQRPSRDDADVVHRRREGRHEEAVQGVQHPHHRGGDRNEGQDREQDARELHGQFELAGHVRVVAGERAHQRLREEDAGDHDGAGRRDQRVDRLVAEQEGRTPAVLRQAPHERRHERRAHRAFGEQVAHQVRDAGRHVEGVHRVPGAEAVGEDLVADQAEKAAGERRRADDARGSREPGPARRAIGVGRLRRRRGGLRMGRHASGREADV